MNLFPISQQLAAPIAVAGAAVVVAWFFEAILAGLRGEQGTIFPRQRGR